MRKTKESKSRQPARTKTTKRTTSRRATTTRSRTKRTTRRTRSVSPKSILPVTPIEISKPLEQPVIAPATLPSKRYPIQNFAVLFLAVAATGVAGGWAVYVALFGDTRQHIGAVAPSVVVDVQPVKVPSVEVLAPKAQDRVQATPSDQPVTTVSEHTPPSAISQEVAPATPPAPIAPEVTGEIPAPSSQSIAALPPQAAPSSAAPASAPGPVAAGPSTPRKASAATPQVPAAVKGKRRGHPEATVIAGPAGGAYAMVAEARRHLGTNPTGRKELWCGAFVDLVLKKLGYRGGGNLASAYARYGKRVPGPQIGAIAVMTRKGGGHVGIVSGFDKKGRPIIISGNYRRTVAEVVYPAGRIYAYVIPKDWDRALASTH